MDVEFGVEGEEPRFGDGGDFRDVLHIDDEDAAAAAVEFREVSGFGFLGFKNFAHFFADRAVFDGGVEFGDGEEDLNEHAHGGLLKWGLNFAAS